MTDYYLDILVMVANVAMLTWILYLSIKINRIAGEMREVILHYREKEDEV